MIRPQGDVLFEYLERLPRLKSGVNIHIHDVFTPRDYLRKWVVEDIFSKRTIRILDLLSSENPESVMENYSESPVGRLPETGMCTAVHGFRILF